MPGNPLKPGEAISRAMPIDIDQLTYEELIALNLRIVERVKYLESMQAHREKMGQR